MIPRRFCATAHREYDRTIPASIPLGEAVPMPEDRFPNPAMRAAHCAIGAHTLALKLARNVDLPEELRDEAAKVALLVSEIPADVAALSELVERQQEDMRGMCDEGIAMAKENTDLRRLVEARSPESPAIDLPLTREPRTAASGE